MESSSAASNRILELEAELQRLRNELEQEREDARRIIGLRQDRIDALTAELGNVRTQWNRMRIAKERAEAKNAALEARLETLTKPVTDEEWDALSKIAYVLRYNYDHGAVKQRAAIDAFLASRSQQAPASEEKP